jgi:hypothetical protein
VTIARRQRIQPKATNNPDESHSDTHLKAFDLAADWAKHITTLSIGTLVLSATFIKDVLPEGDSVDANWTLFVAWALLTTTAILGVLVQSALVAQLSRMKGEPDVYAGTIRAFSSLQFLAFFAGIAFFAVFAGMNL